MVDASLQDVLCCHALSQAEAKRCLAGLSASPCHLESPKFKALGAFPWLQLNPESHRSSQASVCSWKSGKQLDSKSCNALPRVTGESTAVLNGSDKVCLEMLNTN